MNIMSAKFISIAALTFLIVFLMNYIGNPAPDRLQNALLTACGGVIGLTVGMWIYSRRKGGDAPDFD